MMLRIVGQSVRRFRLARRMAGAGIGVAEGVKRLADGGSICAAVGSRGIAAGRFAAKAVNAQAGAPRERVNSGNASTQRHVNCGNRSTARTSPTRRSSPVPLRGGAALYGKLRA
jgi:hypothetical protein